MNEQGRINSTLPFIVLNRLTSDSITFNLNENEIVNLVYSNYRNEFTKQDVDIKSKYAKKRSLYLQTEYRQEYIDIVQREILEKYNASESEFFRGLLFQYAHLPIFEREQILFSQNFKVLKEAILNEECVILTTKKNSRKFEPYFIKQAEEFSYVFGYCSLNKENRLFRVSTIKTVRNIDEKIQMKNEKIVQEYQANFDPFLSYGKRVKVKFTDEGIKKYNIIVSNRPKRISNDRNTYIFECSEKKAQVYFPQFFKDVEILEPISLRQWYKTILEEALEYYKND